MILLFSFLSFKLAVALGLHITRLYRRKFHTIPANLGKLLWFFRFYLNSKLMFILLQTVKRRNYFLNIFSAYMSIDFGSSTAFMPQQLLYVA